MKQRRLRTHLLWPSPGVTLLLHQMVAALAMPTKEVILATEQMPLALFPQTQGRNIIIERASTPML